MLMDEREKRIVGVIAITSISLMLSHQLLFSNSPYYKVNENKRIVKTMSDVSRTDLSNKKINNKIAMDKTSVLLGNAPSEIVENATFIASKNQRFEKYKHNQKIKFSRGEGSLKDYLAFVKKIREAKDTKIVKKLKKKEQINKNNKIHNSNGVKYTNNDVSYLARLIFAEAGNQPYVGKVAVGSIVVNRMKHYKMSLYGVINAPRQFSSVGNRNFNKSPNKECVKAAREALNGNRPLGDVLYYANMRDINYANRKWFMSLQFVGKIGEHSFFKR